MRLKFRVFFIVAAALSTAVISLDSSSFHFRLWTLELWQLYVAIGVIALSSLYSSIDAVVEHRRNRRRATIASIAHEIAFPLWASVTSGRITSVQREQIGVHVWIVPTWHWTVVPRWVRRLTPKEVRAKLPTPPMWRAALLRLRNDDAPTHIAWRRGVGALGMCWKNREAFALNLRAHWGNVSLDESQWSALSLDDQLGLKYREYKKLWPKYHSVVAVPIFRRDSTQTDPEFIGCVAIDAPYDNGRLDVTENKYRNFAMQTAHKIEEALAKKSSW